MAQFGKKKRDLTSVSFLSFENRSTNYAVTRLRVSTEVKKNKAASKIHYSLSLVLNFLR